MEKLFYVIWKDIEDRNVNGVKDLIGYFYGTWEEADRLVERMNAEDVDVAKQVEYVGRIRYGYWKDEVVEITHKNLQEFITQ